MTLPTMPADEYRRACGIVVFNPQGKVWLGERAGMKSGSVWQFPQGGMDAGETPLECAVRELQEETGISARHISLLAEVDDWLYYDIPRDKPSKSQRDWHGQTQKWFAFRFSGTDADIDLSLQDPQEFSSFRWGTLQEAVKLIVPFKQKVYARLMQEFAQFES